MRVFMRLPPEPAVPDRVFWLLPAAGGLGGLAGVAGVVLLVLADLADLAQVRRSAPRETRGLDVPSHPMPSDSRRPLQHAFHRVITRLSTVGSQHSFTEAGFVAWALRDLLLGVIFCSLVCCIVSRSAAHRLLPAIHCCCSLPAVGCLPFDRGFRISSTVCRAFAVFTRKGAGPQRRLLGSMFRCAPPHRSPLKSIHSLTRCALLLQMLQHGVRAGGPHSRAALLHSARRAVAPAGHGQLEGRVAAFQKGGRWLTGCRVQLLTCLQSLAQPMQQFQVVSPLICMLPTAACLTLGCTQGGRVQAVHAHVEAEGYGLQEFTTDTTDGHILTLFRILPRRDSTAVHLPRNADHPPAP